MDGIPEKKLKNEGGGAINEGGAVLERGVPKNLAPFLITTNARE